MKAVVMEIKKNRAAVITENYGIKTIRNRGYKVGERIEIGHSETIRSFSFRKLAVITAAVIILFVGAFFTHTAYRVNYVENYTVQVDINPSIKFSVSSLGRVIKAYELNDDAKDLDLTELKGKNIYDALDVYIKICIDAKYIENGVSIVIIVDSAVQGVDVAKIIDNSKMHVEQKLIAGGIEGQVTARKMSEKEKN